jgi:hypothetical protein
MTWVYNLLSRCLIGIWRFTFELDAELVEFWRTLATNAKSQTGYVSSNLTCAAQPRISQLYRDCPTVCTALERRNCLETLLLSAHSIIPHSHTLLSRLSPSGSVGCPRSPSRRPQAAEMFVKVSIRAALSHAADTLSSLRPFCIWQPGDYSMSD